MTTEETREKPGAEQRSGCQCPLTELADLILGKRAHAEARRHFSQARREVLLGIRSLIDERLSKLEREPQAGGERVTRIVVE